MAAAPRVLTVPAGTPFLPALARAILSGNLPVPGGAAPAPLDLPRMTLLLPTRRACKAMLVAFLDANGNRAMLLPRIRSIGGADEDENLLHGLADEGAGSADALDVPPAIDPVERHLALTSLVMRWNAAQLAGIAGTDDAGLSLPRLAVRQSPAEASALARGLARLMDQVETEGADLSRLATLAPDEFAEQWRLTLDFLKILSDAWPQILKARGQISLAERRNRLLALEAAWLTKQPPADPYIVAGVSGSIPATARLMQVVAGLPQGAVVLSGLDQTLPDDAWAVVHPGAPSHPQFRLAALMSSLGIARGDVKELPRLAPTEPNRNRTRFIGEALRPASATVAWRNIATRLPPSAAKAALIGIERLDAGSPEEEAEAIALILRRAAEDASTTAALISPDRTLARRVATRLESWGITMDDSAGRPLAKTAPGVLLDLALACLATDWSPAPLLALLKHPLTRLGLPIAEIRRGARMLELRALRRPNLGRGLDGLRTMLGLGDTPEDEDAAIGHHAAISGMAARDRELAAMVLARLEVAFAPLLALGDGGEAHSVSTLVAAHVEAAEKLATDETGSHAALWAETAGETAALYMGKLLEAGTGPMRMPLADYPEFHRALISTETARQPRTSHPRLAILGPFEARLLAHDIVILGGLNDGAWPEIADPDPWLNRPMLAALGLPQPETRIGDSAHDFVQLLGAKRVYLTRAAKLDGAPTVPSRWLLRFEALLAGLGLGDALTGSAAEPWLGWAQNQKALPEHRPRPAPQPRPPLAARPRKLSVTRIEQWMANPYSIYARDILRLEAMPALGGPPEASVRGQIIHGALHKFSAAHPEALPAGIAAELVAHAEAGLARLAAHPRVAAFWKPRFARFATWFAETEPSRRIGVARAVSEVRGSLALASSGGPFLLSARADRIDVLKSGALTITDYKTGTPPGNARVVDGLAPQLPLEAAIAAQGGFEGIAAAAVTGMRFVAAGGGDPPGTEQQVNCEDVGRLAADTLAGLQRLIALFDDPATPYAPLRRPAFRDAYRYDDYAHLARVAEWSLLAEEGGND